MSESASKRILMVEDEDIAFLIRYMLERHGFVVDHAADGRQALDHFAQAAPPDLTLMDIMLPYHDGLELIERLRAQAGKRAGADADRQGTRGGYRPRAGTGRRRLRDQTLPAGGTAGTHSSPAEGRR